MPILSMFYGIIIRMQNEKGGKHHKPHIHCIYGNDEIVIALDGEILEGNIPRNKFNLTIIKTYNSRKVCKNVKTNCQTSYTT